MSETLEMVNLTSTVDQHLLRAGEDNNNDSLYCSRGRIMCCSDGFQPMPAEHWSLTVVGVCYCATAVVGVFRKCRLGVDPVSS
jgi:hypothetical protein